MKWMRSLAFARHGESLYNILKRKKAADPEYAEFRKSYEGDVKKYKKLKPAERLNANFASATTRALAVRMAERYALDTSDQDTDLSDEGWRQAVVTGRNIATLEHFRPPQIVIISPYKRTRRTFDGFVEGGLDVKGAKIVIDDRAREQEHGQSLLYSDWRIFHVFHPEQMRLYDLLGPYWYQYPQGESVLHVRDRIRSLTTTLVREYAEMDVMIVSHHLTKLAFRSIHERLEPEEFMRLDREEKPVNCGITIYHGDPEAGTDGKLVLVAYNKKLY